MSKTFYLAGPMRGMPQSNIPVFEKAARDLRKLGYSIVSPIENEDPASVESARASTNGGVQGDVTWGKLLAKDVILIADQCQGIIFLPDWQRSEGAKLEAFVGLVHGGPDFKFHQWWPDTETLDRLSSVSVLQQVYSAVYAKLVA